MNTEDTPTTPGRPLSNLRVHRAFDQFDAIMFDAPILPMSYVGVRKSTLRARRLGVTWVIWMGAMTAAAFAIIMTLAVNSL